MNDELKRLLAISTPAPWYFDGRDIFSEGFGDGGHRLVIPLPETWHESQGVNKADAELIVAMRNAIEDLL